MTKVEFTGRDKRGVLIIKVVEGINYRDCEMKAKKFFKKVEGRKVLREETVEA